MFAVVLDTCVLWPSLQRDFLLSLAIEGLYRPLWSETILEELEYHEARKLVERGADSTLAAAQASRLIEAMQSAFDDALVENWEPHEGSFGLPDPDDEHVLAAAVVGNAGAIVTHNMRDFPMVSVPSQIQILGPAAFAADAVSVSPDTALHAVEAIASRHSRPPETVEQILDRLVKLYGMGEAVDLIRSIT
ncbi:PIN domain-containing protein [Nocardia colli]|uniref:PIN domain-containing protein n=1 Tax=Nocardia colli TaxID=2545717 RepID=A0A5N0EMF5_9NOCA|nr:PIN domain-containing protein [Nocardia colli]KAA8890588.1 PIN domain-containing protein [Nocardia colli]